MLAAFRKTKIELELLAYVNPHYAEDNSKYMKGYNPDKES